MNTFLKNSLLIISVNIIMNYSQISGQRVFPPDCDESDRFGSSVDMSGDYAIIGSPMEEEKGNNAGAAYIYKKISGGWEYDSKLIADNGTEGDSFGWSVAIDGDYAIVGAPYQASWTGMAYIFKRVDGVWLQQEEVTDQVYGNNFGWAVAIHGNRAAVGAVGAAYVFTRNGDESWSKEGTITEGDAAVDFGKSISLFDNYLVVAPQQSNGMSPGEAYVYRKIDTTGWQLLKKLTPSDGGNYDTFGISSDINKDYIAVGSYAHMTSGKNTGAVYIYDRNDNLNEQAKFVADDASYWHGFGTSVSLSNNYILVGASNATASYIFNYNGTEWKQYSKLNPVDINNNKSYGCSVSMEGGNLLVGAYGANANGNGSGAVFFYTDLGVVKVESYKVNIPKAFLLSQNYPNPFNPSTTIKYEVPSNAKGETSNIRLIIYDILGREVALLVNKKQKPGFYEVTWEASNQPSGVYFYKLRAGVFTETKKMILLR